ncbi:MAG: exodeoxyribonuclease V subunit beta [Deltaproteobacteria bacterium]
MSKVYAKKPAILAQLPHDRHAVIEASAGTGKTYTLEHLVIDLLLEGDVTLDQLLVVTFTEKAAAELRARLRKKMTELVEKTESDDEENAWCIDDDAKKKLARALLSFDAASISTIHAFCQRVLAENAFESARHFEQELVDGRTAFDRAFYEVLRTRIAHHDEERVFLDAWLSGRSLPRLVSLLWDASVVRGAFEPEYDEDNLVATLRTLARLEMSARALRPAMQRARMHAQSIRAILERVVALRRILDSFLQDGNVPAVLAACDAENRRASGFLRYAIDKLEEHVTEEGKLKELLEGLRQLDVLLVGFESAVCQRFLPLVQAEVRRRKAKRGELDFDDMLTLLAESLDGDEGAAMVEQLRRRFAYALIDEFQDTDETQWRIFSKLFVEDAPKGCVLYVIGDPKQAIYGFRGADVHTYLEARERITEAGGHTVHLTESFRASEGLVAAVNHVLDDEADPSFFTGQIRYDHPVRCGDEGLSGFTRGGHALTPVALFELVPKDEEFKKSQYARATLADAIAKETVRLLSGTERDGKPVSPADIFVLTRSADEGLEIAKVLRAHGVAHAFYKQDGLFQTQEARDVYALLAAIANPMDQSRRLDAWRSPFFAVPIEDLGRLDDLPGSHRLMKTLFEWKSLADDKRFERLFFSVLEETGLIERALFLHDSERELTNYLHIFEILVEETNQQASTLPELLSSLRHFIEGRRAPPGEDGNVQRVESDRDAVQIMTMHKAKGLEAAAVFLYGGFDEPRGSFAVYHEDGRRLLHVGPGRPRAAEEEAREENQRLLYVAMTRAKARLYLPYVRSGIRGSYQQLNDRLDALVFAGLDAAQFEHVEIEEVERKRTNAAKDLDRLATWSPPDTLFQPIVDQPPYESLHRAHRGFDVTSYSRIKAQKGGYRAPTGLLEEEIAVDVDGTTPVDPDVLPSGAATGRFIHEMLELVDPSALLDASTVDLFAARRDVRALFVDGLRRYDLDARHLFEAQSMVYTAMLAPVALGERRVEGLVHADRLVREMEFHFPFGEPSAPDGFVKGFIDLVVEHEGRVYVLDWKSDLLANYDAATIDAHVAANYDLQAQLYSLALVKLFRLDTEAAYEARFGGAVYCFLRGMKIDGDGTDGVYFSRPSFGDLMTYGAGLTEIALPGDVAP